MLHELLETYIPSRSYLAFLKAENAAFTDFEAAAILNQIELPVKEKLAAWKRLLEETEDRELRAQLAEELTLEQKMLERFREKEGGFLYVVWPSGDGEDPVGFADDYETAYALGIGCEGDGFRIEKHRLCTASHMKPPVRQTMLNPYMFPGEPVLVEGIGGSYAGCAKFRRDGTLLRLDMEGVDDEDPRKNAERLYSPSRFTNAYIEYPYPFESGGTLYAIPRI